VANLAAPVLGALRRHWRGLLHPLTGYQIASHMMVSARPDLQACRMTENMAECGSRNLKRRTMRYLIRKHVQMSAENGLA